MGSRKKKRKAEGGKRNTPEARATSSFLLPPSALREARVLVVGDVMLDRYWIGDASRISPEAPVPVVLFQEEMASAGGAANVARNCAALKARTRLLSVVGDDSEGELLSTMLKKDGVQASLHKDASIRTT